MARGLQPGGLWPASTPPERFHFTPICLGPSNYSEAQVKILFPPPPGTCHLSIQSFLCISKPGSVQGTRDANRRTPPRMRREGRSGTDWWTNICSEFPGGLVIKDPALSPLWLGFDPWPGNFHMPGTLSKTKPNKTYMLWIPMKDVKSSEVTTMS